MAIRLTCTCGQRLSVGDRLLGRTISCPVCDSDIKVAAPAQSKTAAAATKRTTAKKSTAAADPELVRFRCDCGRKLKAPTKYAGRKTKCPDCGQGIRVPETLSPSDTGALKSASSDTRVDLPTDTADLSDLLDEIGAHEIRTGRRCHNCKHEMALEAVLCVKCGWDRRTDKVRETQHGPGGSSVLRSVKKIFSE